MKNKIVLFFIALISLSAWSQTNPAITSWLQNNTVTGTYYVQGNSTALSNGILVNCQEVEYSANCVYVHATGVPAYATGPFPDGNPSNATNQDAIFKFTLNPQQATGNNTASTPGNIGVFINGVALFDYRDGVAWNPLTNNICGGPGNPPCPGGFGAEQDWNRDAIPAEMAGFDCSKAHPAMGNYHHHQNPSAFKLDLNVLSDICNLYDADGLYAIDSTQHSPLIGFAYDGFPMYGAYGYANADGTGGITRIKSGYQKRNITTRTTHPDGTAVDQGPDVSTTYPLGYFREDYEWLAHSGQEDYLDVHNGRFCVTPEYPDGIYCYFATVDENWNSTYPYLVGPTFYGVYSNALVTSVTETTTTYVPNTTGLSEEELKDLNMTIFPNPASDLIAIQANGLLRENLNLELYDLEGRLIDSQQLNQGSTIWYFDTRIVYPGNYFLKISSKADDIIKPVVIIKN